MPFRFQGGIQINRFTWSIVIVSWSGIPIMATLHGISILDKAIAKLATAGSSISTAIAAIPFISTLLRAAVLPAGSGSCIIPPLCIASHISAGGQFLPLIPAVREVTFSKKRVLQYRDRGPSSRSGIKITSSTFSRRPVWINPRFLRGRCLVQAKLELMKTLLKQSWATACKP